MKQYIYDIFLNKLDDNDNITKLIDSLPKEDKKEFLVELMKKCEFTKEEFYSNSKNKKINLLCYLNEKGKLEINYNNKIEDALDDIRNVLETGSILKEIRNINDEEERKVIIQKLGLIKLVLKY